MSEQTPKTLNHFALYRYSQSYYSLPGSQKSDINQGWFSGLSQAATCTHLYQVFPAQATADVLVWSALEAEENEAAATFFNSYARSLNPYREWLQPVDFYWGFTKPSQYTKTRSTQEMDPFHTDRLPYLVLYPFSKTVDWYLMGREARQGMMNEHIRIGKQYPEISQLLLYSFGLQDQEFIVVYETNDLGQFSDLVYELRDTQARRYTLRDTPLTTALYHPPKDTLALWE